MNARASAKLRIGDWCVDPNAGLVSRGAEAVRLEARTLRLLIDLAEHAGEVVSLDDLLDRVWAGVIVTPDSVYQAVASLRRLLGDDPRRPRYIATVPRLGYRLVAKVEPWIDDPPPAAAAPPAPDRRVLVAAGLTGVAALAIAGGLALGGRRPAPVSVGVLPFLDMTDSMANEVLTDDLTEALTDRLSQDRRLSIPSARAAFALKGRRLPPMAAAKALGVARVVDGSVHGPGGGPYRITVRLLHAETGFVAWSRVYDRTAAQMPAAAEAISSDLIGALLASPPAN
jgi:DNA-binding winged helix-turn-helix (wHTH) protein/TolB-like protein